MADGWVQGGARRGARGPGTGCALPPDLDVPPVPSDSTRTWEPPQQLSRAAFAAAAAGCVGVLAFYARNIFLFSDDYIFLDEARRMPFDWTYLSRILFTHFSPVTRAMDAAVVTHLPGNLWLVYVVVVGLAVALVLSVLLLMTALFGRSALAMVGLITLGVSLTLLPVVNWFTAAVNILPALAGGTVCFAALVLLIRGRSRWWALAAVAGYLIAVLAWELASLIPGYALIWVVLFHTRVTRVPLRELVRQTWWVWTLLAAIGGWTVVNYLLNYYSPAPSVSPRDALTALSVSLFETTLPTAVGFHDPDSRWFTIVGLLVAALFFGWLIAWTVLRSRWAWRGWLFAFAGWLVPCAALVVNRVGYFGVDVARQVIYLFLPSLLITVGVLEAVAAATAAGRSALPSRVPPNDVDQQPPVRRAAVHPARRATLVGTAAVMVAAYLFSAPGTASGITTYLAMAGSTASDHQYPRTLLAAADRISPDRTTFSLLNGDAPNGLVPAGFAPYNRLDRVMALHDPTIKFDTLGLPLYQADGVGELHPVTVDWLYQLSLDDLTTATGAGLAVSGADILGVDPAAGLCVAITAPDATVVIPFDRTISGNDLVVRTMYSVEQPAAARLLVQPPNSPFVAANGDDKQWQPGVPGQLDTVSSDEVGAVAFDAFEVGSRLCLSSVSVGTVRATG